MVRPVDSLELGQFSYVPHFMLSVFVRNNAVRSFLTVISVFYRSRNIGLSWQITKEGKPQPEYTCQWEQSAAPSKMKTVPHSQFLTHYVANSARVWCLTLDTDICQVQVEILNEGKHIDGGKWNTVSLSPTGASISIVMGAFQCKELGWHMSTECVIFCTGWNRCFLLSDEHSH